MVNHLWRTLGMRLPRYLSWPLTMLCVLVAWVFFRANTFHSALAVLKGMWWGNGLCLPTSWRAFSNVFPGFARFDGLFPHQLFITQEILPALALGLVIAFFMPNTQQIFARYRPALEAEQGNRHRLQWRPTPLWALVMGGPWELRWF